MSERWWAGLGPIEVRLDCSGDEHVVRWQDGQLSAAAHGDVFDEQALAALAGERSPCLQLLELWERHRDDLQVLVVASRGPGDPTGGSGERRPRTTTSYAQMTAGRPRPMGGRAGVVARAGSASSTLISTAQVTRFQLARRGAPGTVASEEELVTLVNMAGPLLDRLAGTVAATWAERIRDRDDRAAASAAVLEAALYGRVLFAARAWSADPALDMTVSMISADEDPSLERRDGRFAVALPFEWVSTVWARGLTIFLGRFVLAASEGHGGRIELSSVDADLTGRHQLTVELTA